jgi:hypothetical protein
MRARLTSFAMLFLLALVVWNADPCPAATIRGTVVDSLTSAAVAAAVVKIKGTTDSTVSDTAGRFTLNTGGTGLLRPGTNTAVEWGLPSDGRVTLYGADGSGLAQGRSRDLTALASPLPDGMYLFVVRAEGAEVAGKLLKAGSQFQTGRLRPATAKAAANVTLVFSHNHYRTKEQTAAEGDDDVQVSLVLKKGWELDETNTGLAGVGIDKNSLPLYTGSSQPARGTVIRLKKITTGLSLYNGEITIDRCWFQPTGSWPGALIVTYNTDNMNPSAYSSTITDCDIDGSHVPLQEVAYTGAVRGQATVRRCHFYDIGSGIAIHSGPAVDCLVEQNYVHGLRAYGDGATTGSHNESGTIRGYRGNSLIWRNNRLISKSGSDSGALFIQGQAGSINHVLVEGNLMETYGWCMPLEAHNNGYGNDMRAVNNRFVLGGYGPSYVSGGPGWAQWTENYYNNPNLPPENKGPVVSKP